MTMTLGRWEGQRNFLCQDCDRRPPALSLHPPHSSHTLRCVSVFSSPRTEEKTKSQRCWATQPTSHSWAWQSPAHKPRSTCHQSRRASDGRGCYEGSRTHHRGGGEDGRTSSLRVNSLPQVPLDEDRVWSTQGDCAEKERRGSRHVGQRTQT